MRRLSFKTRSPARAAMLLAVLAVPAPAKGQAEITPRVGVFASAAKVASFEGLGLTDNNLFVVRRVDFRQSTALLVGADASLWLNPHLGLEATAWYSPSGVSATATSTLSSATGVVDVQSVSLPGAEGHLVGLSGRLLLGLPLASKGTRLFVLVGPGLLARAGELWQGGGTTDATLVFGAGLRLALAPRLAVRAMVEDHLSKLDTALQNDFTASIGLTIAAH